IDPVIDFGWGLDAPAKEMHADHFTVRWTGQIESKVTGLHVFVCDADDSADLWLDEQPIPRTPFKKESSKNPPSVALVAGKRYDVRFEYREVTGPASVRLGWAPPGQNRELIPTTAFFCTTEVGATNTGSITEGTTSAPVAGQAKGIYLRSGSFITGSVKTVNEANVQFAYRSDKEYSVLPREVSRIVLRSPPRAGGPDPAAGRTGILLQSGEFFEGEITGIANGQVLLSSVLFGLRKYNVADVCVIYSSVGAGSPARFSVHLRDGTVFRVDTLYPEGDELILFEPILGQFRVALSAITEIRNSSERAGQDFR
ncbi:MAG: Ricin lectin, partial [Verrucomicrobiales bacterium]|nr:Ricin lectin [Verrucomicrobiales bacterium]